MWMKADCWLLSKVIELPKKKEKLITSIDEDIEKLELSYTAAEKVK